MEFRFDPKHHRDCIKYECPNCGVGSYTQRDKKTRHKPECADKVNFTGCVGIFGPAIAKDILNKGVSLDNPELTADVIERRFPEAAHCALHPPADEGPKNEELKAFLKKNAAAFRK